MLINNKMGNLCCCFVPKYDDNELKHKRKQKVFTIYNNDFHSTSSTSSLTHSLDNCEFFKSSQKSINELRLLNDLSDINVTKISRQMTSFTDLIEADNDSGFNSRSDSPSCCLDMDTISLEPDCSDFSLDYNRINVNSYGYSLMYTSISTVPLVIKNSFNNSFNGFKQTFLKSKFLTFIKSKIVDKPLQMTRSKSICDNTNKVKLEDQSNAQSTTKINSTKSIFYNTGINSLRQVLLRIYDVNYF